MMIGYARVSKEEQNLNRQIDQLTAYGAEKIIQEKYTGTRRDRPGIDTLFNILRPGDSLVVESISRLGRNTLDILLLIQELTMKEVQFISLKENMNTATPTGKAMLQMMSVISELERNLLADRVREGIKKKKKRGVRMGRPKVPQEKLDVAVRMYQSGDYSVKEIAETNHLSLGTLYKELNRRKLSRIKNKASK